MPVESTLSTKELRKTWTGKSSRAKATTRKPCPENPLCSNGWCNGDESDEDEPPHEMYN